MMEMLLQGIGIRVLVCYGFQTLGLVFSLISGVSRSRKLLLLLVCLANLCSVVVFFLAGRFDGSATAMICSVRAFLVLFRDQARARAAGIPGVRGWLAANSIGLGCTLVHLVVGILTWQSPVSLLIVMGPVVLTLSQWFGSVDQIKYGTMFSSSCWLIFDLANGVYVEAFRDLLATGSNIIGLRRGSRETAGSPRRAEA